MVNRKVYAPETPPSSRGKCIDETTHARYVVHVMRTHVVWGRRELEVEQDGGPATNFIVHGSTVVRTLRNAIGSSLRVRVAEGG